MATFDKAVHYEVTAVTKSPLRTGPSDGEVDKVLRHRDGQAFLQASSLVGALHDWLEKRDSQAAETLFGSQKKAGQLYISDAEFAQGAEMQMRPRLRINGKNGSADKSGKFDVAHIARDTELTFKLTWLGREEDNAGPAQVEQMLAALNGGKIYLGAQKTNGFGRVRLSVRSQTYHMSDKNDRDAWLNDRFDGKTLTLPAPDTVPTCRFTVHGVADSILVKSSAARFDKEGKEYTVNLYEGGKAVLPGSSIKGAVRSRVQMIADLLNCPEAVDTLFGRGAELGDNGIAGRVRFGDAVLDKAKAQKIHRIRINKFTGGVIHSGLFNEEPLSSGVTLQITAPQEDARGCALLTYALRDLGLGLYNLGSGGAIGRGYIKVSRITVERNGEKAAMTFNENGCKLDDPNHLVAGWLHTLEVDA